MILFIILLIAALFAFSFFVELIKVIAMPIVKGLCIIFVAGCIMMVLK